MHQRIRLPKEPTRGRAAWIRFVSNCAAFITAAGLLAAALILPSRAQVPDAPASPSPAPTTSQPPAANATPNKPSSSFLGKDLPAFDPGTEILTWDGRNWNINNNRLFAARFEKYLNAPEATTAEDQQYQAIINGILTRLAPANASRQNVDAAFRLLFRGSVYDVDARLCDALADAVSTVWAAQRQQQRIAVAIDTLERERRQHEWNARVAGEAHRARQKQKSKDQKDNDQKTGDGDIERVTEFTPNLSRLAETMARIKANELKRELSEIAAKAEYQALIASFFLQRRFQHVLMATRFYRAIFSDGDSKLNIGTETKEIFARSAGMAPTVSTLDSLANEAVRDVREGIKAFDFLLERDELESATKRLAEAFTVGEFMPEIRRLPRAKKRQALAFAQKSNQLISAIEVKDYTLAERLVHELGTIAKDFDNSKAMAAIEGARTGAQFLLSKARNAALSGDRQTLEQALTAATELWPRNPALAEVSKTIFEQGDVQQKALLDFDQLLGQKNYRQILENSPRFIAATALYPERQARLQQVLKDMQTVEGAMLRAEEMRRQNNFAGAWESVEAVAAQFPSDSKLNQMRADLTTQAADFVRTLRGAQDLEKREQIGASMAWYLKAQKIYPGSDFARAGVERLKKRILPDS